jgi:pimeloyl-ACP methyl ester carboxylesterase
MSDLPAPFVPDGRILDLPGRGETFVRVHEGPPGSPRVVLLHGWTATADLNWFGTYRPLAERMSFVAIDHRGHGRGLRTERPFALEAVADDTAAALAALGWAPVTAVGYSMGGPIALHLARRHPGLVDGLVMAATAGSFRTTRLSRLQWLGLPLIGLALRCDIERLGVVKLVTEVGASDEVVAGWRDRLIGEAKRTTAVDLVGAGRSLRTYDSGGFAATPALPTASVVTVHDRMVSPRDQWSLAEQLGALVLEVDGDHDAFVRQRPAFAAAIVAAVEGVAARRVAVGTGWGDLVDGHRGNSPARPGPGRRLVRRLRRRSATHAVG